ncbi:hypothetical protein I7I51_05183, partial [Histoplasma capsulatum]
MVSFPSMNYELKPLLYDSKTSPEIPKNLTQNSRPPAFEGWHQTMPLSTETACRPTTSSPLQTTRLRHFQMTSLNSLSFLRVRRGRRTRRVSGDYIYACLKIIPRALQKQRL